MFDARMPGGGQPEWEEAGSREALVSKLVDALRSETRLLRDLLKVIQRQSQAVATTDSATVADSVFATHRVLHTLTAAQGRRRSINRLLVGTEDLAFETLVELLGEEMTGELRTAHGELTTAAAELAQELETGRHALRAAASSARTPAAGEDGLSEDPVP